MQKMKFIAFAMLSLVFINSQAQGETMSDPKNMPAEIRELAAVIKGKTHDQVRAEIIRRFGPAQRDQGNKPYLSSRARLEEWDVEGGVLMDYEGSAPAFRDKSRMYYLLPTSNPIGDLISQSFEMSTLPDPKNHGTMNWLGQVNIYQNLSYDYKEGGVTNYGGFFSQYPAGKVSISYPGSITAETPVESLAENTVVANLTFTANGKDKLDFSVVTSDRLVYLKSKEQLHYTLTGRWKDLGFGYKR